MHALLRGSKAYYLFTKLLIKPDFPSLADEIAEPHPDMNIKVAAFTVREKSRNTMLHVCLFMAYILPDNSLKTLLNILNNIWTTGKFPEDWQYATIIPIPKLGKDPAEPYNYRPIALTSCLCKTLERMINKRLKCFFQNLVIIHRGSSDRSTTDNLVRLETFIHDAFISPTVA